METEVKSRLRLMLRAEKAAGLTDVSAPKDPRARPTATKPAAGERTTAGNPLSAPRAAVAGSAPATTALFQPPASEITVLGGELHDTTTKRLLLDELDQTQVRGCVKCRLCETRTNTVFGEGDADAKIFFIGEGPGETEDLQGRPFVGRAGELLNKMIAGMGLERGQVFIANIVKCRPPNNRVPAPDEVATCTPYLVRQLEIVRPKVIVTLGLPSTQYMLQTKLSMGKMRGQWQNWHGVKLMPTYHPAYVLRNPTVETRAAVWSDLKMVLTELGLTPPTKKNSRPGE
jgi:uracil-DNA glycosylase family 4